MRTISASMRQLLTQGGPFIGENRASVRLTVEPDFWLTTTSGAVGNRPAAKLPIRWWQRADNSQTEVEIPNIQQVAITTDLSQQAATLQVQIYNTSMDPNGVMGSLASQLGEPGFFSWTYGSTAEAKARWNQQPNAWANVLRENALIRVYVGYGGRSLTIPEAVSAGNLILKGVFLLDDPVIESNGILTLNGRDMAKLLIDQQTIPPIIPKAKYPLNYWGPFQSYQIVFDEAVLAYGPGKPRQITGFATMPKQNDYGADGDGYRLFGTDGGVFDFGSASFKGSMANTKLNGPISGGDVMPDGQGYRMCGTDGGVFDFGSANFYGSGFHEVAIPIVSMRNTPSGAGYYLVSSNGAMYCWGDAVYRGGLNGRALAAPIVDMAITQDNGGYWLLGADGGVFTFGNATFHGRPTLGGDGRFASIEATGTNKGYWCVTQDGAVYSFGDAKYYGGANLAARNVSTTSYQTYTVVKGDTLWAIAGRFYGNPLDWPALYELNRNVVGNNPNLIYPGQVLRIAQGSTTPLTNAVVRIRKKEPFTGSDAGYWLCAEDGGVFSYGHLGFHGSLPGSFEYPVYAQPDYTDYADIIKDLALWGGFWLYEPNVPGGQEPGVYGIIETTGAYDTLGPLGIEFFDKRPIIDVMTDIANLVGYVVRCDDVGSLRFQAPNIWQIGNFFDETGQHTNLIPQIDERITLSDYQMTQTDQELRSPIVVAVSDPYLWGGPIPGTNVTTFVPPYTPLLKGITKSAMFAVPLQVDATDQAYFAELIALRIWLASRTGTVRAWCDPSICVGDQVQIFERQTGEVNVHYVKAMSMTYTAQDGKLEMQLTTNWLGSTGKWAITSNLVGISEIMGGTAIPTTVTVPNTAGDPSTFTMTNALAKMLGASGSAATSVFAQAGGNYTSLGAQ
jgi:hypothetical protein